MNIMIDNQTILCIGILLPAMTILVFSQWLRYHKTGKIAGEMIAQIPMTTKQKIFRFLFQVVVSFLFICFFPQIRRMHRYNFLWDFAYIITAIVVSVMFALVYSSLQFKTEDLYSRYFKCAGIIFMEQCPKCKN